MSESKSPQYPSSLRRLEQIITAAAAVAEMAHADVTHRQTLARAVAIERDPRFHDSEILRPLRRENGRLVRLLTEPKPLIPREVIAPYMRIDLDELRAMNNLEQAMLFREEALRIHREASDALENVLRSKDTKTGKSAARTTCRRDRGITNRIIDYLKTEWRENHQAPSLTYLREKFQCSVTPVYAAYSEFHDWPEFQRTGHEWGHYRRRRNQP